MDRQGVGRGPESPAVQKERPQLAFSASGLLQFEAELKAAQVAAQVHRGAVLSAPEGIGLCTAGE